MSPHSPTTCAIATAIVVLLLIPIQAAAMANSGYLEQVVTMRNTGASSTQTTKVYWEANRMRVETYTVAGVIVEIQNSRTLYAYNPAKKEAVKTTLPNESITVQARLKAMAAPVEGGKKVGTETLAGLKCDVFTLSSKEGNARVCISTDSRFPLKMKTQVTKGTASQTTEICNLKLNYNVPDTLFVLPKGTKVVEAKPQGGSRK